MATDRLALSSHDCLVGQDDQEIDDKGRAVSERVYAVGCLLHRDGKTSLSQPELTLLRQPSAEEIGDRGAFLQDVAAALQGQELGDGMVYRVVAQVQRRYYDPPILLPLPRWGR
jgi:hypothetical protein